MTFPLKIIGNIKSKAGKVFEFDVSRVSSHNSGFILTFSGALTIDWGDLSTPEAITSGVLLNHAYLSGDFTAKITGDINTITVIQFVVSQIVAFRFTENAIISDLRIPNQKLIELDLSKILLTNQFYCYGNAPLTNLFGLNGDLNQLFFYSCDLPSADLSNTTISGLLRGYSNSNLTTITFASSGNGTLAELRLHDCDLDYNNFTVGGLDYEINNATIRLENNLMTTAEVNHILYDFDQVSTGGFTGRTLDISGTNAAPDGSSGGYDGLTAKANLIVKGFTVTTN